MKLSRLTADEKKSIKMLKELEKVWPKSLWIYSAAGSLCVMRKDPEERRKMNPDTGQGFDAEYVIAKINIENDGGDW